MKNGEDGSGRNRTDEQEIMEIVGRLPPEYVRKVLILARTLENIFSARCAAHKERKKRPEPGRFCLYWANMYVMIYG